MAPARTATRARLSTYVRDVLDVARSIPDGPVVLVGHSFGGLVVQHAMSRYPARAAVLVAPIAARPALGTVLAVSRRKPLESLRLLAGRPIRLGADLLFHAQPPAEAQLLVSQCETEPPLAQYQLLLHLPPKKPATTMPVLCVASTDDRVVPIGSARATARRYAAEVAEYSGLGHDLMLDVGWREPWRRISQWLQAHRQKVEQPSEGTVDDLIRFRSGDRRSHAALNTMMGGNPDGFKSLYSTADDVILGTRSVVPPEGTSR